MTGTVVYRLMACAIAASLFGVASLARESAAAEGGPLVVVAQDRAVSVEIEVVEDFFASCIPLLDPSCSPDSTTTETFPNGSSAPDAGPFVATASRAEFPSTFASQDSQISATAIRGSGSHAATASFSTVGGFPITFHSEFHDVESRLVVDFEVDAVVAYSLTGSVSTGGAIFSSATSRIRLSGPGGVIAEVQVDSDPDCGGPECFSVGPEAVASAGTLDPGAYTLEALAGGRAGGIHSTAGSFGTGIDGAFDLELTLAPPAVPALAPGALALLGVALLGVALLAVGVGGVGARVRLR